MIDRRGVTVVGSLHSDLIASATQMPTLGSSVLGSHFTFAPGGKAGNLATQIARLGVHAWLVSRVGQDPLGDALVEQLAAAGVDGTYLTRSESSTGASTIFAIDGEYASIIVPGAAGTLAEMDLIAATPALQRSGFVATQLELGLDIARAALDRARLAGATTVLNASPLDGIDITALHPVLESTDILVVNRHEASLLLAGHVADEFTDRDSAQQLRERFDVRAVVVTCGADGAFLARDTHTVQQRAFPISVVDSIGAGDAFLGALIAGWIAGVDDEHALRMASAAGALAASSAGAHASLPDRATLDEFLGARGLLTGEQERCETGDDQEQ